MKLIKYATSHCPMCNTMSNQLRKATLPCETIYIDEPENEHFIDELSIRSVPVTILYSSKGDVLGRWQGVVNVDVINQKIAEGEN